MFDGTPKPDDRPLYVFQIPAAYASTVKSFGLVEITADEELLAAKLAGSDRMKIAHLLASFSLREVDGKPVSFGDGSSEAAFRKMAPKERNLLMTAYADIHTVSEEAAAGFLKARTTKLSP